MPSNKKKKSGKRVIVYRWAVAYINSDHINRITQELADPKYAYITAYVPCVKVLKKKIKKVKHYDDVPLLFDYGFFKIPSKLLKNPEFLSELKERVSCIDGWVIDTQSLIGNPNSTEYSPKVGYAKPEEVQRMMKAQEDISLFSKKDIENFQPGDTITLKTYPFENMKAEILFIDKRAKKVKVSLILDFDTSQNLLIDYDHVFYTVYEGYDPDNLQLDNGHRELEVLNHNPQRILFSYE